MTKEEMQKHLRIAAEFNKRTGASPETIERHKNLFSRPIIAVNPKPHEKPQEKTGDSEKE